MKSNQDSATERDRWLSSLKVGDTVATQIRRYGTANYNFYDVIKLTATEIHIIPKGYPKDHPPTKFCRKYGREKCGKEVYNREVILPVTQEMVDRNRLTKKLNKIELMLEKIAKRGALSKLAENQVDTLSGALSDVVCILESEE